MRSQEMRAGLAGLGGLGGLAAGRDARARARPCQQSSGRLYGIRWRRVRRDGAGALPLRRPGRATARSCTRRRRQTQVSPGVAHRASGGANRGASNRITGGRGAGAVGSRNEHAQGTRACGAQKGAERPAAAPWHAHLHAAILERQRLGHVDLDVVGEPIASPVCAKPAELDRAACAVRRRHARGLVRWAT